VAELSLFLMSHESGIVIELLIREIDTACARKFEEICHKKKLLWIISLHPVCTETDSLLRIQLYSTDKQTTANVEGSPHETENCLRK
jgi:hypothetical protein